MNGLGVDVLGVEKVVGWCTDIDSGVAWVEEEVV